MFCTNCGASNKNGVNLCVNCGESLKNNPIEDRLSRLRALNDVSSSNKSSFLHLLFDFSFHRSVTVKMMKFLYILSILFAGLMALFFIFVGFETSIWFGIFALLIVAPVVSLLTVIFIRVFLEMILVVFRTADHVADKGLASGKEKTESREGIQWNV
jgi:hypothetical protein